MENLTKESWENLTDDEKTQELQEIMPGVNYKYYKELYNMCMEHGRLNPAFENPCLSLKLIDPVLTMMLWSWMYSKGKKLNNIPLFGYRLEEITIDKSSLMNFTNSEKDILSSAIKILQDKGGVI